MIRFFGSHEEYNRIDAETGVMGATLVIVENDRDHLQAKALVERLRDTTDPSDQARLIAQARLIEAYEQSGWPRRTPTLPQLLTHLMDQHGLTRAQLAEFLATPVGSVRS